MQWYLAKLDEMTETLRCAIEKDRVPSSISKPKLYTLFRLFPVTEGIKAGFSPGPITQFLGPGDFLGYLEVDQVLIDNRAHRIVKLHPQTLGDRVVNMLSNEKYVVIKVTGKSMNKVNVNDGDYVLLRPQTDGLDNDIVATVIIDEVKVVTLKRLIKQRGKIILRAESDDPAYHGEKEFDKPNVGYYIRGVALAVLKPL